MHSRAILLGVFSVSFFLLQAPILGGLPKQAKRQVEARYQKTKLGGLGLFGDESRRFVEELKTALVVVFPGGIPAVADTHLLLFKAINTKFDVDIRNGEIVKSDEFTKRLPEGSILGIWRLKLKSDRIELWCRTPEPIQILDQERIVGTYLSTKIRFYFDENTLESGDVETVFQKMDKWVLPFTSRDQAEEYARDIGAKEIQLGMTIEEVERIFGLPGKKALLGEKVIYSYDGMVVEFIDGIVADVKF